MTSDAPIDSRSRPGVDPRNLVTVKTFTRREEERSRLDTISGISEWLIGPARQKASFTETFDELAWRMARRRFSAAAREPA